MLSDSKTIEALLEKWAQMLSSATPSVEPFILAGLIVMLISVLLLAWNVKALLDYISIKESGQRVSALAWVAWGLSIISPWTGPLVLIITPLSLLLGVWSWLRLAGEELGRRAVIPARMAVVNSVGIAILLAVVIGAFYLAFGSILREILREFWQHKEIFRDYIVT